MLKVAAPIELAVVGLKEQERATQEEDNNTFNFAALRTKSDYLLI
jgi:hypothetical protein